MQRWMVCAVLDMSMYHHKEDDSKGRGGDAEGFDDNRREAVDE